MAYGTIAEFRATFTTAGNDEFITRSDSDLQEALDSASAEIESYLSDAALSVKATEIITRKCYFLARLFVYKDQALDMLHPVVREAENVRKWLRYFSEGRVSLPGDADVKRVGGISGVIRSLPELGYIEKYS